MVKVLATAALLACALTACAPIDAAPIPPPAAPTGAVALHRDAAIPADIDKAFRDTIAGRYGDLAGPETVTADLTRNGFICTGHGVYPQIQPGGLLATCDLPKPHGLCSDKWTVDLKLKDVTGAISIQRVAAEGRFTRFCVAGASPDG